MLATISAIRITANAGEKLEKKDVFFGKYLLMSRPIETGISTT